jgi:hypothetical protein
MKKTRPTELATKAEHKVTNTLQEIRERVLRERLDISQTIAELDAWRNEIDATLAFLKAQRGEK